MRGSGAVTVSGKYEVIRRVGTVIPFSVGSESWSTDSQIRIQRQILLICANPKKNPYMVKSRQKTMTDLGQTESMGRMQN